MKRLVHGGQGLKEYTAVQPVNKPELELPLEEEGGNNSHETREVRIQIEQ